MDTEKEMLSFLGSQEIKDEYIARLEAHYRADEIVKGVYFWGNGKGGAIGCTIHSDNEISKYETELGIKYKMALLENAIFEKLPNEQAKEFPIQFLKAIPVGIDTNIPFKKFAIWNLTDEKEGLIHSIKNDDIKAILKRIADTYTESLNKEISPVIWNALCNIAASAFAQPDCYVYPLDHYLAYIYSSAYARHSDYTSFFISSFNETFYKDPTNDFEITLSERAICMRDKLLGFLRNS